MALTRMTKTYRIFSLCLVGTFLSPLSVSSARAGFEWTPPPATAPTPAATAPVTPQAVPVMDVQGSMLPMPGDSSGSAAVAEQPPVAAPARTSALPPALLPAHPVEAQAEPSPSVGTQQPVQRQSPVIKTLTTTQQNVDSFVVQPVTPPPVPVKVQSVYSAPAMTAADPVIDAKSTLSPAEEAVQRGVLDKPYVAAPVAKKRIHYSEWLTEAQAQELSMKVNRPSTVQNDPLEPQGEGTALPADTPVPAVQTDPLAQNPAKAPEAAPITVVAPLEQTPVVTAIPLETPHAVSLPAQGDVMPLLSAEDMSIAPYPMDKTDGTASAATTKIILPADAPAKTREMGTALKKDAAKSSVTPKKEKAAVAKPVKENAKENSVLEKIPDAEPLIKEDSSPAASKKSAAYVGFGTDIPLAFAMEQILPEGYSFDFGEKVNPEQRVSWQGGKPWQDVVKEILKPLNLKSRVENKVVYITHG